MQAAVVADSLCVEERAAAMAEEAARRVRTDPLTRTWCWRRCRCCPRCPTLGRLLAARATVAADVSHNPESAAWMYLGRHRRRESLGADPEHAASVLRELALPAADAETALKLLRACPGIAPGALVQSVARTLTAEQALRCWRAGCLSEEFLRLARG